MHVGKRRHSRKNLEKRSNAPLEGQLEAKREDETAMSGVLAKLVLSAFYRTSFDGAKGKRLARARSNKLIVGYAFRE